MRSPKNILLTFFILSISVLMSCTAFLSPENNQISNELNILSLFPANGSSVKWNDQLIIDVEVKTNNFDTSDGYKYFVYLTEVDSNGEECNIGNVGNGWLNIVTHSIDTVQIKYDLNSNFNINPHGNNSVYNIYYSKSNNLSKGMPTLATKQIQYLKDHSNDPPGS